MPKDKPIRPCADHVESVGDLLSCKKTGKTMTWDDAFCPNKGKTCAHRAECQIPIIIAEKKDNEDGA